MIETYWPDGTITQEFAPIDVVQPRVIAAINNKRDTLIEGGFDFHHGASVHRIQSRQSDRENIIGLSIAASAAIAVGAQPGDYRWVDVDQDFVFITADNVLVPLDAQGMISLYIQAMAFKSNVTFHARSLKDQVLACADEEEINEIDIATGWPGE